ncbi:coumaroyl-CoA:anthocyanidin 3-O-glucoside-6''-O-coumaroyltransferase 1-like [Fagus crenata]
MALTYAVKVLEQSHVSPPPGSVPTTSLPLTFLDIPWFLCSTMQCVFFYELPYPTTNHFTQTILPNLKHSLSLVLQLFFPLAAKLRLPPLPHMPHILYTEGDSVLLTIAESRCDFNHLIGNHARDVRESHPLVPKLLPPAISELDNKQVLPDLLAIQVTVFPNSGISIGITFSHLVADGRAFHHFMKSWACIYRTSIGDLTCLDKSVVLPFLSRDVIEIEDPNGFKLSSMMKEYWSTWAEVWREGTSPIADSVLSDKVRATFVLSRAQIGRLKSWVSIQYMNNNEQETLYVSTFVVVCAIIWRILETDMHGVAVPATYFGNYLAVCFSQAKRKELMVENGIVTAVKAIGKKVQELESGAFREAEKWLSRIKEVLESGPFVSVAGSPKLGVYETNFGWGRPKKSEVLHIDDSKSISLAESRDEEGGIEVGLALSRSTMENFKAILEQDLQLFSGTGLLV